MKIDSDRRQTSFLRFVFSFVSRKMGSDWKNLVNKTTESKIKRPPCHHFNQFFKI